MPAELPAKEQTPETQSRNEQPQALPGLSVDNLTPGIARQLGIPAATKGVLVVSVDQGSSAEEAGVQRG